MENEKVHIRHVMLWEFKQGNSAKATAEKICTVYGEGLITDRAVRNWFVKFRFGDTSLKDEPRAGRPSDFDDNLLKTILDQNPRQSTRGIAKRLNISKSTVNRHLEKLGKVSKLKVSVPHNLSEQNKEDRVSIATNLLSRVKIEPFLNDIVTGDRKWIPYENKISKRRWLDKDQPPQPPQPSLDPKTDIHGKKVLLCVWWDCRGIIYHELLKPNLTITADRYVQQLQRVQEKLNEKRPALVNRKNIILLHDNVRSHTAKVTQEKILELGWSVLPHPPYSPDLAPTNYHLFSSLKNFLNGKTFKSEEQVNQAVENFFQSKPTTFYKEGIDKLPERWEKVIHNNGEYII
ncbi:PREDICTED: histone-lysine N-methyltransferase SETMAR-like [Polistes canadensis]|uniref:histone-lysine N-methyltransferase SETMAR-like n=1 Tax=Polistes canadensis TaxID=91411 RepID=UPI000718C5B8|nr:PREDICTED: histone-lysine N-methyltransferase SETMAR-like [Polistes canadensis]